jgi:hypothetical protein
MRRRRRYSESRAAAVTSIPRRPGGVPRLRIRGLVGRFHVRNRGFRRDSIGFENRPGLNEYLFHHGPVLDPHPNNTCGTARDTGQYMPNRTRP